MSRFQHTITSEDIDSNDNITINPFNGNEMYLAEYYAVEDELNDLGKDWNDISKYVYEVGLIPPAHVDQSSARQDRAYDGYTITVFIK